ncbi:TPA: SDR family NAD(P)-dependent oxidoreductase, partial [Pseudomonas aeruginosa]|nr:SDR family NAD(P)-dependent oxidoreductase [Pseudomonas aeruginosa]
MNDETSFNPFSLSGRRILVTGASSGLGLAIAQSCARMGAELIVTGRDQTRLDGCLTTLQSISELPHRAVQADLRVAEECAAVVAAVDSEIHGLVH